MVVTWPGAEGWVLLSDAGIMPPGLAGGICLWFSEYLLPQQLWAWHIFLPPRRMRDLVFILLSFLSFNCIYQPPKGVSVYCPFSSTWFCFCSVGRTGQKDLSIVSCFSCSNWCSPLLVCDKKVAFLRLLLIFLWVSSGVIGEKSASGCKFPWYLWPPGFPFSLASSY